MVNINFHQIDRQDKAGSKKGRALNSGFLISIFILSVSFLAFFGMKVYRNTIESRIVTVSSQINEEIKSVEESRMSRVADFQRRLEEIDANISSNKNPKETLAEIESLMAQGVVLTSYEYDSLKKSLTLEAISDNFQIISRQMLSLKDSGYFENVRVPKASMGEDGKTGFTLESQLTFKKDK